MIKSALLSKKKLIVIVILIIALGGMWMHSQKSNTEDTQNTQKEASISEVETIKISDFQSGNSFISAIGTVESQEQVELRSELSSTVNQIYVALGDTVTKGQLLVELDHSTLDAQLQQASSSINRAKGSLEQQLAGATDESIKQAQASIDQAQAALDQAVAQLENTKISNKNRIENAKLTLEQARKDLLNTDESSDQNLSTNYDNALNAAQSAFSTITSTLLTITDVQYKYFDCTTNVLCQNIVNEKSEAIKLLYNVSDAGRYNLSTVSKLKGGLEDIFTNPSITQKEISDNIPKLITGLFELKQAAEQTQVAMGSSLGNSASAGERSAVTALQATLDGQIASLTNANNAIKNTSLSGQSLQDVKQSTYDKALENYNAIVQQSKEDEHVAQSNIDSRKAALNQAQAGYDAVVAGPRDVDLLGTRAGVQESQAAYQLIKANRDKAFIRAPFDGVVSVLPVKRGELVSPGTRLVGIVNDGGLQVSAYVNERDRMLLEVGAQSVVEGGLTANVVNIAPSVDPLTRKVRVISVLDAEQNNDNTLLIDQFVRIQFEVNDTKKDSTYLVPLTAVKTTTRGSFVFTVEERGEKNYIVDREIQVGRIIGENIEVTSGASSEVTIIKNVRGLKVDQEVMVK